MARSRLCRVCREFHDIDQAWPVECHGHFGPPAHGSGPQIISDTIEPFRNMATGEIVTSKSRYRADLKARGLIEVGNDRIERRPEPMPRVRETLRQTWQQLRG